MLKKISNFCQITLFHLQLKKYYESVILNNISQVKKHEMYLFFQMNNCQFNLITTSSYLQTSNFHFEENDLFFIEESKNLIYIKKNLI